MTIQLDKLQRVLNGIVNLLPATPNESDTAQIRSDIATLDEADTEVTTDPTLVSADNPTGVVDNSTTSDTSTATDAGTTSNSVETPTTDPAFVTAENPEGIVPSQDGGDVTPTEVGNSGDSQTTDGSSSTSTDSPSDSVPTEPTEVLAPFPGESSSRSDLETFLSTASESDLESLDAYVKQNFPGS